MSQHLRMLIEKAQKTKKRPNRNSKNSKIVFL